MTTKTIEPRSTHPADSLAAPTVFSDARAQHYAEEDHEGNVLWSLRTREWKIIHTNAGNHRGLPEAELFDIDDDAAESKNLAGSPMHADVETELAEHADLQRAFAEGEAVAGGGDVEMNLEECRQLMNLGYVEDCSHLN